MILDRLRIFREDDEGAVEALSHSLEEFYSAVINDAIESILTGKPNHYVKTKLELKMRE